MFGSLQLLRLELELRPMTALRCIQQDQQRTVCCNRLPHHHHHHHYYHHHHHHHLHQGMVNYIFILGVARHTDIVPVQVGADNYRVIKNMCASVRTNVRSGK